MSALKIIEENPALAIGSVAVLLLVMSLRGAGGSTSASSMINAQLESQKTAGATDVAISKINADAAAARNSNLAQVYTTQIVNGAQLASTLDTNRVRDQLGLASLSVQSQQITAQQQVQNASIVANHDIAAQNINAQITALQDSNNLTKYQLDMTAANLPLLTNTQIALGNISAQNMQAIAAINTAASRTAANTASNTASNNSNMGWVSTLAGIAALFL